MKTRHRVNDEIDKGLPSSSSSCEVWAKIFSMWDYFYGNFYYTTKSTFLELTTLIQSCNSLKDKVTLVKIISEDWKRHSATFRTWKSLVVDRKRDTKKYGDSNMWQLNWNVGISLRSMIRIKTEQQLSMPDYWEVGFICIWPICGRAASVLFSYLNCCGEINFARLPRKKWTTW